MGIDIGFGASGTGITMINTISKDVYFKYIEPKGLKGFSNWAKGIYPALDEIVKTQGKPHIVCIEKNFGKFRSANTMLDMALGVVVGWCCHNDILYDLVNPSEINTHIGAEGVLFRIGRKPKMTSFAKKSLGKFAKKIENLQDLVDSFCVADLVMYKCRKITCKELLQEQ